MSENQNQYFFESCTSLDDISELRNQYLDGLIEPQELYLELMIRSSQVIVIIHHQEQIGYFIIGDNKVMLEFFINQNNVFLADEIFKRILQEFSIEKALCKSYDHLLLSCCAGMQKKMQVIGILFKEFHHPKNPPTFADVKIRLATSADEKHIIAINEEVFDHDYEVLEYIINKQLLIFEKEDTSIGFGLFSRIIEGRPDFDIGMLVEKDFRRQGIGQFIIYYLADHCLTNGWRPIAGCAVENIGSRRTLERAGFVAGYRMLEFLF